MHVHSDAPPGKLLLQLVNPNDAVRVDVFGAVGETLARMRSGTVGDREVRFVAPEDAAARLARTLMALERNEPVPRKFAADFRALVDAVDASQVQSAWRDHRNVDDPGSFDEACNRIALALALHGELLVEPVLSTDIDAVCQRCKIVEHFPLASRQRILRILGYC